MPEAEHPTSPEPEPADPPERFAREHAERARQRRIMLDALGIDLRDPAAAAECECSCHPRPGTPDVHADGVCACQLTADERRELWTRASETLGALGEDLRATSGKHAADIQAAAQRLGVVAYEASPFAPWVIAGTADGRAFYMRERFDTYSIVIADDEHPGEQPWTTSEDTHAVVIKTGTADEIYLGSPPDHGQTLEFIVTNVRDYLRRAACDHVHRAGDRFCPACGLRLTADG